MVLNNVDRCLPASGHSIFVSFLVIATLVAALPLSAGAVSGKIDRRGSTGKERAESASTASSAVRARNPSTAETKKAPDKKSPESGSNDDETTSGHYPRSIRDFGVECNGTDQYENVQNAFNAAANNAFELIVDCPVTIHTAKLLNKTVFIGSNTTVSFTPTGVFYVDNVLQPAFAIMNSSNIALFDWNIVYTGNLGVGLPDHTGYKFNDVTATSWLSENRNIVFARGEHSQWQDTYNTGAIFYIVGEDSNLFFSGFHITAKTVLEAAGKSQLPVSAAAGFIPCVFTIASNWKSGTSQHPNIIRDGEPLTAKNGASPTDLMFDNITLDGTIMGFVGSAIANTRFANITSIHYSDVQDVEGHHIGGDIDPSNNGPWTPPPHLFYFINWISPTEIVANSNLSFTNINDANLDASGRPITYDMTHTVNPNRVGGPRDTVALLRQQHRAQSGYALSIKLMCGISSENAARRVNGGCTVNNYTSYRPDGFLAVSDLNNVTFQNVKATFDSNYTDGLPMYRPGIWFPGNYSNLTFKNMVLTDVAAHALTAPIGYSKRFYGLTFEPIDPATNSTGVIINVNSTPDNGVNLYDNNLGQSSQSIRWYSIARNRAISVGP